MTPIIVNACAKINLGLLITAKRPDGYHTLETIFAPINWYDTIEFTPADTISMSCTNLDLPVDDNNLCIKAAKSLQNYSGISNGVAMKLHKEVPFGAGLGGGSSDAAAVLRTLNKMWELHLSTAELHSLAVKLGADVPYFLAIEGIAYAGGIGDELEDTGFTIPYYVVTVFPEESISTAWAYKNFYARFGEQRPHLKELIAELCTQSNRNILPLFENDFQPAVFDYFPNVRELHKSLLEAGSVYASLSGSGSAVFGLFENEHDAKHAITMLPSHYRSSITEPHFRMKL